MTGLTFSRPWRSKSLFASKLIRISINKRTRGVRVRYDAILPPFISIKWCPRSYSHTGPWSLYISIFIYLYLYLYLSIYLSIYLSLSIYLYLSISLCALCWVCFQGADWPGVRRWPRGWRKWTSWMSEHRFENVEVLPLVVLPSYAAGEEAQGQKKYPR